MADIILGYLINNLLIDSRQYENWRNLERDELKTALSKAGIMSDTEFEDFSQQLENSLTAQTTDA